MPPFFRIQKEPTMLVSFLVYLLGGAVAGVLAGLLGVGGGIVIVPMLVEVFRAQGMPAAHIMHMALGTSLASIMFTSVASFMAHHRRGAVDWSVVRNITPGIITGTLFGSWVASLLSTGFLKGFFALFLFYVAAQMLLDIKPKGGRNLPGLPGLFGVGNVIGLVSALVGIGGGTLSVPFLVWCNMTMHTAVGASAAIGFPIALSGCLGNIVTGWKAADLPAMSLGYVYLPATVGLAAASMFTAKHGARLAHALPVSKLKKIFAALLLAMGTRMLWSLLAN